MSEIWIVLTEERHGDVDAQPFSTEDRAIQAARFVVTGNEHEETDLTPAMREDGWVLCLTWGTEGERVRVIRRFLGQ